MGGWDLGYAYCVYVDVGVGVSVCREDYVGVGIGVDACLGVY